MLSILPGRPAAERSSVMRPLFVPNSKTPSPVTLTGAAGRTLGLAGMCIVNVTRELRAAIVLAALRWQRVLEGLDLRARLSTLLSYYLAGLFVGNFLPSTIGGDVLRISRLSAGNGESPASFASVVLERLSGWLVLPLLTLIGLLVHPSLLHLGTASKVALVLSIGALVMLAAVVAAGISPRLGGRLAGNKGWLRVIGAVHLGMDR